MFEKFTSRDAGDFRQRYLGTYGYFRRNGQQSLVRLDRINTDGSHKSVEFVDCDGLRSELYPDSDDETTGFSFLPPRIAYHNTSNGAYLLRRVAQRQYLRGISDQNMRITTVFGQAIPVDFQILRDLFDNPITAQEAVTRVRKIQKGGGERSFALSAQFAINLDTNNLYCFGQRIGAATMSDTEALSISLDDYGLWITELRDAIRRAGLIGDIK